MSKLDNSKHLFEKYYDYFSNKFDKLGVIPLLISYAYRKMSKIQAVTYYV